MNIDDGAKEVIWSLQNNKRSEEERNVFKPTGKKPMNKNVLYVFSALGITFLMSFLLTQFSEESKYFCFLTDNFCYDSAESPLAYTFYIFMNVWVLIIAVGIAYIIGKKIGDKYRV
uniref:hypothetical protein n=1 Tax=Flavobacterium sp. TaxID=239 RepID=UPI004049336B